MRWFRTNLPALSLSAVALVILIYVLTQGDPDAWDATALHPGLASGKWAVRFLLLCLAMTPLSTYFRWTRAVKWRKPAGLWAFGFAVVHVYYYLVGAGLAWLEPAMPLYLTLGLLGFVVMAALAATSNRWSMRRLGRNWKRLHRTIYYGGLAVGFHAIFAAGFSKKIMIHDPEAVTELRLYLALLVVLLVVRVPQVRLRLKQAQAAYRVRLTRPATGAESEPFETPHWLPPEREELTPTVEIWRSGNGSFTWAAARESDVHLQTAAQAEAAAHSPEAPESCPT